MSEDEVEARNRALLWQTVRECTEAAKHELELAQGALEDLGEHEHARSLQPLIDSFPKVGL